MHGHDKIRRLVEEDSDMRKDYLAIRETLYSDERAPSR
jgi:hypothetical protein